MALLNLTDAELRTIMFLKSSSGCFRNWAAVTVMIIAITAGCRAGGSDPSDAYLTLLRNFEPYAESVWSDYPVLEGAGYFGDGKSVGNGGIRGTCNITLAYAVLATACPDDPQTPHRLKRIETALRYATMTHVSGPQAALAVDGKKWGHKDDDPRSGWQTNLWTSSLALAAFLTRDKLPPDLVADCKRVLIDESDYRAGIEPTSGQKGNTRAEENGWNSNAVALAAAWLSDHPHQKNWQDAARDYLVNTYTSPADKHGPLAQWVTTVNIYPSYMLENHGFYHCSYHAVSGMSMGDAYLMAKLANPNIARQLLPFAEHNVLNVWNVLRYLIQDNGEFTFPSGIDWSLHGYGHISYCAFIATHFNDSMAAMAEQQVIKRLQERQKTNGDGRFVGESLKNGFYCEGVRARRIAMAWLHHKANNFKTIEPAPFPQSYTKHFDDVGVIAHKSANGFATLSYKRKITALVLPTPGDTPETNYLVAPQTDSLIGKTIIGTAKSADLIEYQTANDGFEARLSVKTDQGIVDYTILSCPDAVILIQTPQPKNPDIKINKACFNIAIENHPLTGGLRTIKTDSQQRQAAQMSGETFTIDSPWCCISEKLGIIYGPAGETHYTCPADYNRNGAAVDYVAYQPKQPLKPTFVVLLSNQNAEQTKQVYSGLQWSYHENRMRIIFTTVNGKKIDISS